MSITTAPATVTGVRATSATDQPFTVTAEITTDTLGTAYLHVAVDGDKHAFKLDPHLLRLRQRSVTDEAERLLQRHAGYRPASAWTEVDGRLAAPVAEIAGRCLTCIHGCGHGVGDTGCAHWQCLAAKGTPLGSTCDGATLAVTAKWSGCTAPQRATRRPAAPRTTKRNRRGDWHADAQGGRR